MRTLHHPRTEDIRLEHVLHALSDPVRLQIVKSLAECDHAACGRIELPVSKSTMSHHFKVLREAGLTLTQVNGTRRLVSLREAELAERFPGLLESILQASGRE